MTMFDAPQGPSERYVVTYVMDAKRRATCHQEGCGVLARARLNQEDFETRDGLKITQHGVIEEGRYLAAAPPDYPAPADHSCVKRGPAPHEPLLVNG